MQPISASIQPKTKSFPESSCLSQFFEKVKQSLVFHFKTHTGRGGTGTDAAHSLCNNPTVRVLAQGAGELSVMPF